MTQILKAEDILQAAPVLVKELVEIPEWNGSIWVRELSAEERDDYSQSLVDTRQVGRKTVVKPNFRNSDARMAVMCCVDEEGKRMFKDSDAPRLGKQSSRALGRICEVCQRLSGMTKEDIEELTKNSSTAPSADSPSV